MSYDKICGTRDRGFYTSSVLLSTLMNILCYQSDYLPLTSHHNRDKKYRFSMERYWAVLVITHVDREENWICLPWVLLRSQPKPTSNTWHYITTKGPFLGLVGWILIFFFILNWFSFSYKFFKSLWKKKDLNWSDFNRTRNCGKGLLYNS